MFSKVHRAAFIISIAFAFPSQAHILADRHAPTECNAPATLILDPTAVPASLVNELLNWIATNTTLDVSSTRAEPPQITFCQTGDIIPYESDSVLVDDSLNGAYDLINRRIVLVQPWHSTSVHDRSVLLHELIHHVQLANRSYECLQQPEWQAYKLQETYLVEHNIASDFDWLRIFLLSRCPRGIHP